jgi:hypothetical protein
VRQRLRYTESLRRELYDVVVQHLWRPTAPGDYVPAHSPDESLLTVMYSHGRWIAVWLDLDEPADAPPDQRAQMSRVLASPDSRFGIMLSEI